MTQCHHHRQREFGHMGDRRAAQRRYFHIGTQQTMVHEGVDSRPMELDPTKVGYLFRFRERLLGVQDFRFPQLLIREIGWIAGWQEIDLDAG